MDDFYRCRDKAEKLQYNERNHNFLNWQWHGQWTGTVQWTRTEVYTYLYQHHTLKHHINISNLSQCKYFEWDLFDVCENVTQCVTSDGVSGCLISGAAICRVITTLTGIMTLMTPDCWLVTPLTLGAPPPPSALQVCSPLLAPGLQSSWPLARGEREERGVREGAPGTGRHLLMMASHTRSPAESWTHSWYHDDHRCRALYWRIGFVQSAVRCSAAEWCAGCVALVMFTAVRVG